MDLSDRCYRLIGCMISCRLRFDWDQEAYSSVWSSAFHLILSWLGQCRSTLLWREVGVVADCNGGRLAEEAKSASTGDEIGLSDDTGPQLIHKLSFWL